jgi:hypothetical protein
MAVNREFVGIYEKRLSILRFDEEAEFDCEKIGFNRRIKSSQGQIMPTKSPFNSERS